MKLKKSSKEDTEIIYILIKWMLIAIPVLWGIYIVYKYGVNMYFWDEWIFEKNLGQFRTFTFLWQQHNEHRLFFPNIVTALVGKLTSWNSKAFMYASQCFLACIYFFAAKLISDGKRIKELTWVQIVEIVIVGFSVYNTAQYENLLWGFQTAWFIIVAFGVISFYFFEAHLRTGKYRYLILAVFAAVISSFSSLHGLTVWATYAVIFLLTFISREKIPPKTVTTIVISAVVCFFIYFYGWNSVSGHMQYAGYGTDQILSYFIGEIGANILPIKFSIGEMLGAAAFLIVAVITVKWAIEKDILRRMAYLAPMIMACGAMFVTSIGRSGGGTGEAVASRYCTNSMMFWTFFLVMNFILLNNDAKSNTTQLDKRGSIYFIHNINKIMMPVLTITAILFSSLIVFRNTGELLDCESYYYSRIHGKIMVCNYEDVPMNDLASVYPMTTDSYHEWIALMKFMRQHKRNVFSDNVEKYLFKEIAMPNADKTGNISSMYFNEKCITQSSNSLIVKVENLDKLFSGASNKEIKNYCYYVLINGKSYQMVWDKDKPVFYKKAEVLNKDINTVQFVVYDGETVYYSFATLLVFENSTIKTAMNRSTPFKKFNDYPKVTGSQGRYFIDELNGDCVSGLGQYRTVKKQRNDQTDGIISV